MTPEQTALREVLTDLLDSGNTATWQRLLVEVGADEIIFDIGQPGSDSTPIDLAILAEACGAALFDGPLLPSVYAGLLTAGTDTHGLLASLRDGAATVGATVAEVDLAALHTFTVEPVWHGAQADWLIVNGAYGDQPAVALYAAADPAVTRIPLDGLDLARPLARVTVHGAEPAVLVVGPPAVELRDAMRRYAELVLAAELLGVAQHALDGTVAYVGKRVQFSRTIGSFQAIKHRLVDLLAMVELTRSAVYGAAWALHSDARAAQTQVDLAVAALLARQSALAVTKAAVQLHGGIGITWEHWAHRYLRRAHATVALTGSESTYRRRLVDLVDQRDGVHA